MLTVDRPAPGATPPPPPDMRDVGRRMARGAVWMVAFKLAERSIGVLSTIVLARLLVPADFGLIAMAMSIVAVLDLLSSFGFDTAIIQNVRAERRHYDTAWTLTMVFAGVNAAVLLLLALPASQFYDEPRLAPVMALLAVAMLVQGVENIGVVVFRKELRISREFAFLLTKKVAGFVVTIALAIAFRNYWALVAGILASKVVGVLISYLAVPYRPRPSLAARAELFAFSRWLLVNNVLLFMNGRSSDFIIGKLGGPHALGLFTLAYEISNLPTTELVAPINRAIFPGYARMSTDLATLRRGFRDVMSVIALFALPAGAAVAGLAEGVVGLALGPQWQSAVPLIRVIAVYGVLSAVQTNSVYVYVALGRPHVLTMLGTLNLAILLPTLLVATAWYGAAGAAWALVGATALMLPLNFTMLCRNLALAKRDLLRTMWRPVLATGAMALAIRLTQLNEVWGVSVLHDLGEVLAALSAGVAVYATVIVGTWILAGRPRGAEQLILAKLSDTLRSLTSR